MEQDNSLKRLADRDETFRFFYDEYIVNKNYPDKEEAIQNLRFFATATVACSKLGLEQLRKMFSERTDAYALLLQQVGYKSFPYYVRRRRKGFTDMLERAFYGIA